MSGQNMSDQVEVFERLMEIMFHITVRVEDCYPSNSLSTPLNQSSRLPGVIAAVKFHAELFRKIIIKKLANICLIISNHTTWEAEKQKSHDNSLGGQGPQIGP
jgi:hypothetical protein